MSEHVVDGLLSHALFTLTMVFMLWGPLHDAVEHSPSPTNHRTGLTTALLLGTFALGLTGYQFVAAFGDGLSPVAWRAMLTETRFGRIYAALVLFYAGWLGAAAWLRISLRPTLILVLIALGFRGLLSHASSQNAMEPIFWIHLLHVGLATFWLTGLIFLLHACWQRPEMLRPALILLSRVFLPLFVLLLVSGSLVTARQLALGFASRSSFLLSSYSVTLLCKSVLVGGIFTIAAGHRRRQRQDNVPHEAWERWLVLECLLAFLVLFLSALLSQLPPVAN